MASGKTESSEEKLKLALDKITSGEFSYRQAQSAYGIPRSTLYDHKAGKVTTTKRGPPTVLTAAEEEMLVQWALHMADNRVWSYKRADMFNSEKNS